jgi:hypothetical protein
MQFTYLYASINNVQATGEGVNLQREHPALQKMKFINCCLILWVIFALLDPVPDPDPGTPLNPDPIQIRIRIHNTSINFFYYQIQDLIYDWLQFAGQRCGIPW